MHPLARAAMHPFRVFAPPHLPLAPSRVPTLSRPPENVIIWRLKPEDFPSVRRMLRVAPAVHAYLLGALDQNGPALFHGAHHWLGLRVNDTLLGVATFGRNAHFAWASNTVEPPWQALARFILRDRPAALTTRALVGADELIEPLLHQLWLATAGPLARFPEATPRHAVLPGCGGSAFIDRGRQVLMDVTRERLDVGARSLALAPAIDQDLPALMAADRAMMAEELGHDVAADTPHEFRDAWSGRIDERRAFVIRDTARHVQFKADIASLANDVALIAGVYTRPDSRGRGLARAGVGELCQFALRHAPRVALAVYEDNLPALRLYRSLGFEAIGYMRSVWLV